ncbi:hypothetical protein AAC387_Pa06g1505 [Persea americana]
MNEGHICQCLSRISSLRRDAPLTISGNQRKTGGQLVDGVLSLARGLSELGVRRGDVVAIAALNSDSYLEWLLAIAYVGGISAPLNYRWSFEEATSAMESVRPVMLVVDESCHFWSLQLQKSENKKLLCLRSHVFLGDPPSSRSNTANVPSTNAIKKPLEGAPAPDYLWASEGIALICFTSGTTGRPKGVAISHTALIVQSLAKIAIVGYSEDDVYLHTAPLCHIGGISSCMALLMVGGCHVFIPRFEAKSAVQAIEQHHVTTLITVPAMMADLVSYHRQKKTWMGGEMVKKILNGGGGFSVELIKGATRIFPNAKLLSAYGMTETCSSLTFMTLHDPTLQNSGKFISKNFESSTDSILHSSGIYVGKPAPHVELCIGGGNLDYGPASGRILTRGAHVMEGYWDGFAAVVPESSKHGWFDTGDIGWIDDQGDLWLMGRIKDRIKSGGENVYPQEVEAVLSQHPGVSGVVVFGVPDARLTEMVAACVQLKESWQWIDHYSNVPRKGEQILSVKTLQDYCKMRNLTGFKIPKNFICWRKPFPVTSTGKLRRDEVKREALSHFQFITSNL